MATVLTVGAWFGMVAGLVEGGGLLLFQRINWERWGPMIHVSKEIIWIAPIVDVVFFSAVALLIGLVAGLVSRVVTARLVVFALSFLTIYDWLTVAGRLDRRACLLLAVGVAFAFSRWFVRHESGALRFWKRTTPWVIDVFAVVLIGIQGGQWLHERDQVAELPKAASGAPNVLVVMVDTLRADHVSYAGYSRPTTPNLDLASLSGVRWTGAPRPEWKISPDLGLRVYGDSSYRVDDGLTADQLRGLSKRQKRELRQKIKDQQRNVKR